MRGTYLYAIVTGEPELDLGPIGLPDGSTPVATVPVDGLAAVMSEYNGPPINELSQADALRSLVVHQQVIERVLANHSVLPVKFGTVLASLDEVRATLSRFRPRLDASFAELGDAVEVDLSATWDPGTILAEIGRRPDIVSLAGGAGTRSAEETLAARIEVGKLVYEAVERRREDYRREIVGELIPLVRDVQTNALPSEDLVLNVAFLVERTQLDRFDATVDRLGESWGDRLTFRYVGPLPPYSFATVELIRPGPDEIESARRLLGLGERAGRADLRARYRQLAARFHPDHNPGDLEAHERFAAIATARGRLAAYMNGQRTDAGHLNDDQPYDLTREAVAGTLLLEIKRASADAEDAETDYEPDVATV